ncbi:mannose-6-phosphate isomerase class I [Parabacteroides sp. PF5-5]|uniref:class I mannose-6-phosphate isomerase n=1 Tax=unclassified Parabacteroides TaxID=2649774 RepID=UPI0024745E50|nr:MULTISPECIES: class I mannose-6-phosphate isomerase [unclassified Parabacteroides]MDH6306529.1 mannose-6-phosphate isomerase class I [Parabacteroides sp. PH5-39]MDH6317496.1 mannose-6-phosphate isomerase class I [Parabacteroides sp. PF5-13]MDH6321201.1 mannose-6-phosphate isomerase class I [Parabacteroides sp. PH5-13]MDH6324933.1 mannose-6-phosphate isomerase class I [Parabacteroides sp. PH5-8]MDH6328642.1 mannose-6-phosphate isomerase class I [Parabacteroides sp. PH5-41]
MIQLSNYDKTPIIQVSDNEAGCWSGWHSITDEIKSLLSRIDKSAKKVVIECYQGVLDHEIIAALQHAFGKERIILSSGAMLSEQEINAFFHEDITDDEIFGYMTRHTIERFFHEGKTADIRQQIASQDGTTIVYGTGASYVYQDADVLIYADMARWEIQQRFRRNEISNIGVENKQERPSLQYKRAFFVDWRVCDRLKKKLMKRWDYVLDTNIPGSPKMLSATNIWKGLQKVSKQPFRVVPFFDPGPWGGQWMKEVCNLDHSADNYAWCFDCVPEENSLLLGFGKTTIEIPSINLVFAYPKQLLGTPVYGRFGDEFPIRFDLLDTMGGGNLSLQVHPLTEYIQEKFGMHYTQDESYYLIDAGEDAVVYLGLKEDVCPEKMITELKEAQDSGFFDAEKHVGVYPVKKHDHLLIPGGTIHCSGKNSLVLEISATPFIFTFKLWDWGRLGLDGKPRPINIAHGENVIQWSRTESWVKQELVNNFTLIREGEGILEEKTGLHEQEFIETRRHWFSRPVLHHTNNSVNVLNLVEGREVIIESPTEAFEPFIVHYAETFIIPAAVEQYTIRPYGESEGKTCATIKAYVRHEA